jgi:hypothetical protein
MIMRWISDVPSKIVKILAVLGNLCLFTGVRDVTVLRR